MKYGSGALISFLNAGGVFLMADLYTVTLQGGSIYRWTNSDSDITYGANPFSSVIDNGSRPMIRRGAIRNTRGTEVDTLGVTLISAGSAQLMGTNISLAAHNGAFDAARVRVERLFMQWPGDTSLGTVVLFEGNTAGVDPSSTQVVLHVKSDLEILQQQMPRGLFQAACANAFGDPACGVNLGALTTAGTAQAGVTASQIPTGLSKANSFYNLGVLVMTSGAAAGSRRMVTSYTSNVATLAVPLPQAPTVGDSFTVTPGCARSRVACAGYSNSNRFNGFPFVPEASTSI